MFANDGKDDTTFPVDIIGSGLAPDELIDWLVKITGGRSSGSPTRRLATSR